jgi:hypothetical protein
MTGQHVPKSDSRRLGKENNSTENSAAAGEGQAHPDNAPSVCGIAPNSNSSFDEIMEYGDTTHDSREAKMEYFIEMWSENLFYGALIMCFLVVIHKALTTWALSVQHPIVPFYKVDERILKIYEAASLADDAAEPAALPSPRSQSPAALAKTAVLPTEEDARAPAPLSPSATHPSPDKAVDSGSKSKVKSAEVGTIVNMYLC